MNDINMIRQWIEDRSREKLRQRKRKRLQILATCVPLVLCISLGGIYAWQAGWLEGTQQEQIGAPEIGEIMETYASSWQETASAEVAPEIEDIMADSAATSRGVTMELAGSEIVTAYMDDGLVHLVHMELQSIMTRSGEDVEIYEEAESDDMTAEIYTLKIFGKTTWEYILQGGTVTDAATGVTYRATQLQWETLCGLLDIPLS